VGETKLVYGVCPRDCPDRCSYVVEVVDGKAVRLVGNERHPITGKFLCPKVCSQTPDRGYITRTYQKDRILHPMKRVGKKGEGRFQPVSWEEALDEISSRLAEIVDEFGGESVLPNSYSGTLGLIQGEAMSSRFLGRLGASRIHHSLCSAAGGKGYKYSIGANVGMLPEDFQHSRFIIIWGSNTITSNVHLWPFVQKARHKGAKVVVIDPVRTRTAAQADQWIPIRPGTDGALALGMMKVIVDKKLHDREYVSRHTLGFERLLSRLDEWPLERVAGITGIDARSIQELAVEYATTEPSAIRMNYGVQRHGGGGMAVRNIALLPALIGAWKLHGGGVLLSTSGLFHFGDLRCGDFEYPETRLVNMTRLGDALSMDTEIRKRAVMEGSPDPPVKALLVYNSNPATTSPDQNAIIRGLLRDDLFTVVLDHFQTDTADFADFILPATTQLEHWDLHDSYGHAYVSLNRPAIDPLGEAKSNTEIFRLLAEAMGFDEPCFRDSDVDLIKQALDTDHPHMRGITFERLLEEGFARLNLPEPFLPFADGGFYTPSGKCEFYSERMVAAGLDPLPTYIPPHEVPDRNEPDGPLALITASPHYALNSIFANVPYLKRKLGKPTAVIHPDDAAPRGISDGDIVLLKNDRGEMKAVARVAEDVMPGVVSMPGPWWRKFSLDGHGTNALIPQTETDMGAAPTYYDVAVWVEKAAES